MNETPEGASVELTVALNRFIDRVDAFSSRDRADSNAQITVDAGGVGVWLCAMFCAVMLVALVMGGLWVHSVTLSHKLELQELRAGEKAIRAYINTGRMPAASEEKEDE